MKRTFKEVDLKNKIIVGLEKEGIKQPTEIQEKSIPIILDKKDIIAQSETGTGKTLAFLLPLINMIDTDSKDLNSIILVPTHELAIQVQRQIETLSKNSGLDIRSVPIIGNVNIKRQIEYLKKKPHIIVGSSGRILELIKKRKIKAHTVKTIVIDEADRMLNKHNIDNAKSVIKTTLKDRQILLFSATITENTLITAKDLMNNPQIVTIKRREIVNKNITHYYFEGEKRDKVHILRKLISAIKPKRVIVFANDNFRVTEITDKLEHHNIKVVNLQGNNDKLERKKALDRFKQKKVQVLIATDVAARGLDIKDIDYIINFDMPSNPKDYLHRVGRTARFENKGIAMSIISNNEKQLIDRFKKTYGIEIMLRDISHGKIVNPKARKNYYKK